MQNACEKEEKHLHFSISRYKQLNPITLSIMHAVHGFVIKNNLR